MATHSNRLPSKPEHTASRPRYSIQSFDTGYPASSYSSYSESVTNPITEYGYNSSDISPGGGKTSTPESFGSRVFNNLSNLSRTASVHTRARSVADSPGAMLARTTSIRLGGLLNRTPTQKQQKQAEEQDDDLSEPEDMPTYTPAFSGTPRRQSGSAASTPRHNTPSRPSTAQPTKAGRFAWFSTPKSDSPSQQHTSSNLTASLELTDPLLSLNIGSSLFPSGPADPHDPASFNDLLLNATALAERLQNAYRHQASLLKQAQAERDAAAEEKDEAATRAAHLKSQLETFAFKAAEQQCAMQDMSEQLSRERQRRVEENAELESLRRWKREAEERHDSLLEGVKSPTPSQDEDSTPRRRKKDRQSDGLNSDSGFESDAESVSYSVETASTISGPMTPGMHCIASPGMGHQGWEREVEGRMAQKGNSAGVWGVVGELQRENHRLKSRVKDLEVAVEGCLEMVG
ncbi:Hypothetical protein D9617_24g016550 [Elsinoe fawcettii]|nr:Hypothetical protein D9617_24g016550 [Elsinoe fawcettii]